MHQPQKPKSTATAKEKEGIKRRTLVRWFLGVGGLSSVAALSAVLGTVKPPVSLQQQNVIVAGDRLAFAVGEDKGQIIRRDSLPPGRAALAFPQNKEVQENLLMVFHLDLDSLEPPTRLDWAPEGFVAYSALCTHLGCTVDFSREPMESAPFPHIHCPCHAGMFNPQAGAKVIAGPPPRPLPQLPLTINAGGELVAAGPFEEPVGVI